MMKKFLISVFTISLISLGLFAISMAEATGEITTGTNESLPKIMIDETTNTIYITGGNIQQIGEVEEEVIEETVEKTVACTQDAKQCSDGSWVSRVAPSCDFAACPKPKTMEEEFVEALKWMNTNGLTMYNNSGDYRMYDLLTREEASKIIGQAYAVLGYPDISKNNSCTFSDSEKFNPTLSSYVGNVCKRGLFKGADGKFMPNDNLTKAQAMAVLIRMFEGKMSYELQTPWRSQYYSKGKLIGLTNVENINNFDTKLTRYEIALMIYRLKNIITDSTAKTAALNKISQVQENTNTGSMNSNTVTENLNTLVGGIDPYNDPELLEAIYWMFDNGLTIYNNPISFKPFETLNRAGAAKIFDKFSDMLGLSVDSEVSSDKCQFTDIGGLDIETQNHVKNVCEKGIIQGNNYIFDPYVNINKSHFIVSLIRMFQGKHLDENTDPWRQNYFNEAKELGLVTPSDAISFENPISRYEVALFLYKFNIKYKMLNSLNNTRIANQVVSTVEGSIKTGSNGKKEANVYLDSNLLKKGDFDIGYVEIFGDRYKIVKSSESTYFSENFVWYGDVFDLVTDEKLGTINFLVSNSYVIETTIRFTAGTNYKIFPVEGTSAFYLIQQL